MKTIVRVRGDFSADILSESADIVNSIDNQLLAAQNASAADRGDLCIAIFVTVINPNIGPAPRSSRSYSRKYLTDHVRVTINYDQWSGDSYFEKRALVIRYIIHAVVTTSSKILSEIDKVEIKKMIESLTDTI